MQKQFKIWGMLKQFFFLNTCIIATTTSSKMTLFKTESFCGNLLSQVCIRTAFYECNEAAGQRSVQPVYLPGAPPLTKPLTNLTVFYFS